MTTPGDSIMFYFTSYESSGGHIFNTQKKNVTKKYTKKKTPHMCSKVNFFSFWNNLRGLGWHLFEGLERKIGGFFGGFLLILCWFLGLGGWGALLILFCAWQMSLCCGLIVGLPRISGRFHKVNLSKMWDWFWRGFLSFLFL